MEQNKPKNFSIILSFFFGGIGTSFLKTMIAPIGRVKIVLQTQDVHRNIRDNSIDKYKGIIDCFKRIVTEEGFFKLYRGNIPNILIYFPSQAINFCLYGTLRKWICPYNAKKDPLKFLVGSIMSGGVAGCFALGLSYPLDFARIRLGADISDGKEKRRFKGMIDCLKKVYKIDGFSGVYKGFNIAMITIFFYRGLYFGGFDISKKLIFSNNYDKLHLSEKFIIAQIITFSADFLSYPLNTVKIRLMMQGGEKKEILYRGVLDCFVKIKEKEGLKGFWKGGLANLWRGIGASLVLVLYDEIQSFWGYNNLDY